MKRVYLNWIVQLKVEMSPSYSENWYYGCCKAVTIEDALMETAEYMSDFNYPHRIVGINMGILPISIEDHSLN